MGAGAVIETVMVSPSACLTVLAAHSVMAWARSSLIGFGSCADADAVAVADAGCVGDASECADADAGCAGANSGRVAPEVSNTTRTPMLLAMAMAVVTGSSSP